MLELEIHESPSERAADGHVLGKVNVKPPSKELGEEWSVEFHVDGDAVLRVRAHPAKDADHAVGNVPLRRELRDIFKTRTSREWVDLGLEVNVPIVAVNTPQTLADDPQFQDRFPWIPAALDARHQP